MSNVIETMRDIFSMLRKNALANPNVFNGRYSQVNRKDAYIEYLEMRLESYFNRVQELQEMLNNK